MQGQIGNEKAQGHANAPGLKDDPARNRVARFFKHRQQHLGRDSRQLTSPYKPKLMMILATMVLVSQRAEQPAQCQLQW